MIQYSSTENNKNLKTISTTYNQNLGSMFRKRNYENKERSNKSVQLLRGNDSKIKSMSKMPMKEVKHDDFMQFLKKKQELLQNTSHHLD